MGAIIFDRGSLADQLSELAGYKAGLALSIPQICDHLSGTSYPDVVLASENHTVRVRAEEYEAIFYRLLYRIGYTEEEYDGDFTGAYRFHKYRRSGQLDEFGVVTDILAATWPAIQQEAIQAGRKSLDPSSFITACYQRLGKVGLDMAMEQLEIFNRGLTLSPHSVARMVEWTSALALDKLFKGTTDEPSNGRFIDQRFIDYLSANGDRLSDMHWRLFEKLTAEFFEREGYKVELGPGTGDDGVDVRVWRTDAKPTDHPLCIVQCKRQKAKVEKVVVKGLFADVSFEQAEYGVLVTSSELSPGAKTTISARGYPVQAVERDGVLGWLQQLRTPGTGIVRS
jgi:restriction system protein